MVDRKRREIALTLLPFALYFVAMIAVALTPDWNPIVPLFAFACSGGIFAAAIYWTVRVKNDPDMYSTERWVWWLLIWLGGAIGLGFLLYYRVWLGRTLGVGTPPPARPISRWASQPDEGPFHDA